MSRYHFFLLVSLLIFTGCGDKLHLGGRVTFPDGEPLGMGTVFFSKDDYLARAHLKPNGTYDVGSLGQKDGLPAGTYKVYIVGALEDIVDPNDPSKQSTRHLIAPEFASPETSPLTITVPGTKMYNIVVERP
jgi:hypothetical protein